jgi:hypothetical protein
MPYTTVVSLGRKNLFIILALLLILFAGAAFHPGRASAHSSASPYNEPTWWAKYQRLLQETVSSSSTTKALSVGPNVDMSNEDTPQSETSITVNPNNSNILVGGSNEIVRLPMRGYFSSDGGKNWGAVDLPLPPATTTNGTDFGSDPGVAFDTHGNVYYSYIVVFFNRFFASIQGTEMAVAKSFNGGKSWPQVTFFNFNSGTGKFNDKPYIAVDTNPKSPFRDSVYVAWDNASFNAGKSSANNALLFARSTDGGRTFSSPIAVNTLTGGPSAVIAADPFVGPNGEVYVAWHDVQNNVLLVNSSFDGGGTFGQPQTISPTIVAFDDAIPAQASRHALLYPACDADRSTSPNRGTLYCSWMDETATNGTDIFVARSTDRGASWSTRVRVNDDPTGVRKDQFNQWLSVDPTSGSVNLSWNDARNDPADTKTDIFFSQSTDGGVSFARNVKVTTAMSDESAANPFAQAHDQYGDYEGIVAFGGSIHPIWTDGRFDGVVDPATGLFIGEEIFTATITA